MVIGGKVIVKKRVVVNGINGIVAKERANPRFIGLCLP